MKRWMGWILLMVCAAPLPAAAARKSDGHDLDLVWSRPGLDSVRIGSIAMLPAASFDGNLQGEKLVEGMLGRALHGSSYRWMSSASTRVRLRAAASHDSLLDAVRDQIKKDVAVDSLTAIGLCERFRVDAVLSIRVDRLEQMKLEAGQEGKPTTTAQVKAALVDASGQKLWTISGSEVGEGPQQSGNSNPYRLPSGGVSLHTPSNVMEPPSYEEVLLKMFERWADRFPAKAAESAG